MNNIADEFIDILEGCPDFVALSNALDGMSEELGFDYYALLHHSSLAQNHEHLIRLVRYPEGWIDEFNRLEGSRNDPVQLASARTNTGFCWSETRSIIALSEGQKTILAQSRAFGLESGFTVPANIPGEPYGSCSFAVRRGRTFPSRYLRIAELVGAHAFRVARRIAGIGPAAAPPHLSRRELQCVELVASGKSDWEIGVILGISSETARQYVKRARAAYGVASRSQLAIMAMIDGRISLGQVNRRR